MKRPTSIISSFTPWPLSALLAVFALCLGLTLGRVATPQAGATEGITEKAAGAAADAQKKVEEAGHAAGKEIDLVWQRISEARLMNRTPDQIVAWVIIGLLVGGVVGVFSKFGTSVLGRLGNFTLGLIGAFIGGIAANVTQLNLGWGPVLIRYEDVMLSLVGALLIVLVVRFIGGKMKPAKKQ